MGRYLIKDVKCGVTDGGMACGPEPGNVVASILFENDGHEKWIHVVEVEGMPNAFITPKDLHDVLIRDDYDAEYVEELEKSTENEICGIPLTAESYYEIFDELYNSDSATEEDKSFIRFVIAIVRLDWNAIEDLKKQAIGKYTDEIDIPRTADEEEYLEENEDADD